MVERVSGGCVNFVFYSERDGKPLEGSSRVVTWSDLRGKVTVVQELFQLSFCGD